MPGLGPDAVTLKAAAIDRLYYTRHYRLGDAIDRIVEVTAKHPGRPANLGDAIALVEAIAPITVGGKERCHWSFASKFGHWFIHDSLPIYDYWAIRALTRHFSRITWRTTVYRDLAEHASALRDASGLTCTAREMDRYLWLSGMYRAWRDAEDGDKLGLSGEVLGLFSSGDREVQHALAMLTREVPSP